MANMDTADWTSAIDLKLPIAVQAHAWIKRAILTLELKPNEALSEKELSLKFGISRTPVREALIKLADEGLVDIFPQRGTYVSPIRMPEVIEAQFIREALETAVVRKAAQTADSAFKSRLVANLAQQKAAVADERLADFMQLDELFHHAMSDFCNLPRGWRVIQNVKGQLDRVRYLSLPHPGHVSQLYVQHEAICEAIGAGDVEVAVDHMSHHLREVFKSIKELMRDKPSLFA
ncbi:DNA-binding GntR family transcriptional regulator [Rhizobium halophytocola]|uniref:DNA-binding GntR family transcriptional regulator n=2 Tax=Rhizobium halophytocola TaxID=735519 RepID=A0ABS4E639_9HYPH|nr:DNA-binding GntR family transcriptional regulator [Rhizobium halophytocola]